MSNIPWVMLRVAGDPPVAEAPTKENVPATRVADSVVTTMEPLPNRPFATQLPLPFV